MFERLKLLEEANRQLSARLESAGLSAASGGEGVDNAGLSAGGEGGEGEAAAQQVLQLG